MQKYFKYEYKYFWEKEFKIGVQNIIHVFKIVGYFKYLYFKYSPTLAIRHEVILPTVVKCRHIGGIGLL